VISHKIDFASLQWETPIPGVRQKVAEHGSKRVRLVEYSKTMAPHWCEKGHFGYILEGQLEIKFDDCVRVFNGGDGVFIPDGPAHRHRAKMLSDVVRAVFVEDVIGVAD
jgi:ethanolamine utilization protein EutQ (cupin superfamily)